MKNELIRKVIPHLVAVLIFLIVAVLYCKPVLEGKIVNQHDIVGWKGMAQQSFEYKEKYGHYPLWTNSMFSGMPTYTIAMEAKYAMPSNYLYNLLTLGLPKPISFFLIGCICFYFLCQVLGINFWISIMAALSFAYASYDPIIIAVGHDTKMQAIGLAPAVIGSMFLIFQKRYLWGLALLSIFFSFQVGTQHLQIIYYTGLTMGLIVLAWLIFNWKRNELATAMKQVAFTAIACIIGFFTFAVTMLPLQEYAKESMRGGRSELSAGKDTENKTKGGLDKDYAFNWSYGISETLTLIVPGIYGGSNGGQEHTSSTNFTEKLGEIGVPEDQAIQMANSYSYWGDQPSTSGPVYLGAVICFLFILGMVYLEGWHKWWIIAASILGVLLAWGKNFESLNYFLFDYLPFYNKFRAPSMALVIPQWTFPLTGALVLNKLLDEKVDKEAIWKKYKTVLYITGGVLGLLAVLYFTFNYQGNNDGQIRDYFANALSQPSQPQMQQQAQTISQSLIAALHDDRRSLFGSDLLRSILFIGLTALLIAAFLRNKIKWNYAIWGILLLSSIDILSVGRRYLNNDSFVASEEFEASFIPSEADKLIMADMAKPFRVFDQADPQGTFNGSRAAYFHNSIGGYHPAKLGLYQDLIERQITQNNMQVLNMLNTKYFITPNPANGQPQAQLNSDAFGPVWLVKSIRFAPTADVEMNALSSVSLRDTAVVQQKFAGIVKQVTGIDSTAQIRVTKYANDTVAYQFSGAKDAFAVFSEVYYPLGWNAYLDGKKVDYAKVNYVLRGMNIPAGNHTIEFIFEPASVKNGNIISAIASWICIILLAVAIALEIKKRKQKPVASKNE